MFKLFLWFLSKSKERNEIFYNNASKTSTVQWTPQHTKVVQRIKQKVKYLPCLKISNPYLFKIIQTDASRIGFGGVLLQRNAQSKEQIVRFYSGTWNATQQN